jgi:hypothetical protein
LIVVNADVTVAYDLHKMKYDIDEKKDNYHFKYSKEEIKISSDIQFYDVNSKLNPLVMIIIR